jgi:hypothetical protein
MQAVADVAKVGSEVSWPRLQSGDLNRAYAYRFYASNAPHPSLLVKGRRNYFLSLWERIKVRGAYALGI